MMCLGCYSFESLLLKSTLCCQTIQPRHEARQYALKPYIAIRIFHFITVFTLMKREAMNRNTLQGK